MSLHVTKASDNDSKLSSRMPAKSDEDMHTFATTIPRSTSSWDLIRGTRSSVR